MSRTLSKRAIISVSRITDLIKTVHAIYRRGKQMEVMPLKKRGEEDRDSDRGKKNPTERVHFTCRYSVDLIHK